MTAQDMLNKLQRFGDLSPQPAQVMDWLDIWQRSIAPDAGKIQRHLFLTVVGGTEYELPANFCKLVEFMLDGSTYKNSEKVIFREEGYIVFPEDLTNITMRYRQWPALLTSISQELSIVEEVQPIAFYYLVSLYYDKEGEGDEESGMAARWMQKYEQMRYEALSRFQSVKSTDDPVPMKSGLPSFSRGRDFLRREDDFE